MGPESLAILELFIESAKSWGCEAVLAWIFLSFLKLFFILVANVETEALQGAWAKLVAPCLLCTQQDVLAMAFWCPPAAEGLERSLDKNKCLVGLLQDELEN